MKAPERLYLRKRNKLPLEVVRDEWYETDPQSPFGSVEYARTDAFTEKALAYLHDKFYFNNVFYGVVSTDFNAMEELFDEFRTYMKGENE